MNEEKKIIDKIKKNLNKRIDKQIDDFFTLPKTEPKLKGIFK